MSGQTRSAADIKEFLHLLQIYDKMCNLFASCPSDIDILDVYTVYDFTSIIIAKRVKEHKDNPIQYKEAELQKLNRIRLTQFGALCHTHIHDIPACWFDCDKFYYDNTEITRALGNVGLTENEQAVLWGCIQPLFETYAESVTNAVDRSSSQASSRHRISSRRNSVTSGKSARDEKQWEGAGTDV